MCAMFSMFGLFSIMLSWSLGDDSSADSNLSVYQKLFKIRRAEHLAATKAILKQSSEKQYKMIDSLMAGMRKALTESRVVLESSGFTPGDKFPDEKNSKLRDALSKVMENAALFGDLVLRIPDVVTALYRRNRELSQSLEWAMVFSNSTGFYDELTVKVIHLAGQELGLVEREKEFVNPYRMKEIERKRKTEEQQKKEAEERGKERLNKKKSVIRKGPKLSGTSKTEL